MKWTNPVPHGARSGVRVFRPSESLRLVADAVCVGGWRGFGVRVFAWPCGTLVVVNVGTDADARLLRLCEPQHLATYGRRDLPELGLQYGPLRKHVLEDLAWARAAA